MTIKIRSTKMLVTYPKIVLECGFDEVYTIMYAVANKYTSDDILRGHWKFHGVTSWKSNTSHDRRLARQLFKSVGLEDLLDHKEHEAEKLLAKLVEEEKQ